MRGQKFVSIFNNLLTKLLCFCLVLTSASIANNTPEPANNNAVQQVNGVQPFIVMPAPNMIFNMPPVNVALNNQNASATDVQTTSHAASISQATALHESITTFMLEAKNQLTSAKKYADKIPSWLVDNKWHTALGCITGVYAYTWYRLLWLSHELSEHNTWHNYKSALSFDELLHIKQKELAQDLIRAIQYQYLPQSVENFFIPFTLFIKNIEKEIETLEQLIKIYKRLHMLHIRWLFPWQKPSYEQAQEKLRRVLYLKNIAFTWLSSFKVEKLTQLPPEAYLGSKA